LRRRGFSKAETSKIIDIVLAEEGRPPESIFDFVQGVIAVARDKPHVAQGGGILAQPASAADCVAEAPDPLAAAARARAVAMKRCAAGVRRSTPKSSPCGSLISPWLSAWAGRGRSPLLAASSGTRRCDAGPGGRRLRPLDDDWLDAVASAYGLAIGDAHTLSADLARRGRCLMAVAPSCAPNPPAASSACCSPTTPSRPPPQPAPGLRPHAFMEPLHSNDLRQAESRRVALNANIASRQAGRCVLRRTCFIQGEIFSGLLVGPLRGVLPATRLRSEDMNAAL
jgi:hypothetical protein